MNFDLRDSRRHDGFRQAKLVATASCRVLLKIRGTSEVGWFLERASRGPRLSAPRLRRSQRPSGGREDRYPRGALQRAPKSPSGLLFSESLGVRG